MLSFYYNNAIRIEFIQSIGIISYICVNESDDIFKLLFVYEVHIKHKAVDPPR